MNFQAFGRLLSSVLSASIAPGSLYDCRDISVSAVTILPSYGVDVLLPAKQGPWKSAISSSGVPPIRCGRVSALVGGSIFWLLRNAGIAGELQKVKKYFLLAEPKTLSPEARMEEILRRFHHEGGPGSIHHQHFRQAKTDPAVCQEPTAFLMLPPRCSLG